MVKKVLFRNDDKFYWESGDLHTHSGIVKDEDLKKDVNVVEAHSGKVFNVVNANFLDKLEKIKRGPQAMLLKDVYLIIGYTGIGNDSVVLDAGTGSGVMSACLARFAKKVISYDKNEDTINMAKKNFEMLNVNVDVKFKDIYEGIDEKELDVIILDLPEPFRVVDYALNALKYGGYFVAYLPSIVQVMEFVREASKKFMVIKIVEDFEREWHVDGVKVRPRSPGIVHTAFLVFFRKV